MAWEKIWTNKTLLSMWHSIDEEGKVIVQGEICRQLTRLRYEGAYVDPLEKAKRDIAEFEKAGTIVALPHRAIENAD